jgi:glycerol-3-phosphate acyltransferase PlsY
MLLQLVVCSLVAYLAGALNLSIVGAKLIGVDGLRQIGSGNPGVTNLFRAAGAKTAVPVLILEILKAAAVLYVSVLVGLGALMPIFMLVYIIGNIFPIFHGFRGGKGVSAAVGTMLAVDPLVMLLGGLVFVVVFWGFKRVSIGAVSMVFSYPVWGLLLGKTGLFTGVAFGVAVILTVTHRANIARILNGTEPRLKGKAG